MYFCNFVIISPWKKMWPTIKKPLVLPSPKDDLCQVWLKLGQWFWRKRFLKFVNVFSLFCNYLLLEKDRALHLNKLESRSPKDTLCQVWLKLAKWYWRRRFKKKIMAPRSKIGGILFLSCLLFYHSVLLSETLTLIITFE